MKKLTTIAFLAVMVSAVSAQKINKADVHNDSIAIAKVLNDYYFRGIYAGDTTLLKQAFDARSLVYGDIQGKPYFKTVQQYIYGVGHRASPKDSGKPFVSEIISIDVINSIASVKAHVNMYAFNYYNFITFHKINGRWLIINKTLSHVDQ